MTPLRVISNIFATANPQRVTLLGLLDLSAAFDCVDHNILLLRLERVFGLSGQVLTWLWSFLTDRTMLRWGHIAGCRATLGSSAGLRVGPAAIPAIYR